MTFGYKLIWQTEMIPYDKMTFDGGNIPAYEDDLPEGLIEKALAWLI